MIDDRWIDRIERQNTKDIKKVEREERWKGGRAGGRKGGKKM